MILLFAACYTPIVPGIITTYVECGYCDGDCVDSTQTINSIEHVEGDVVYPDPPPTGGVHNVCWASWGVHDTDPGDEYWVHNEEHGGVILAYQPADCPASSGATRSIADEGCSGEVTDLEGLLRVASDPASDAQQWIITPYEQLPVRWAAVSWGHRRMLGCFDVEALVEFYQHHVGLGADDDPSGPPDSCG